MNKFRGKRYFANLEGFQRGIDAAVASNSTQSRRPVNPLDRSDADIQSRLDKQAAKLARRAKRAIHRNGSTK